VYLDGVLLHAPFHVAEGASATGSLTGFNGDSLETIVLHPGAFPPRFSDRSAGVLELETRDGTRQRFMGRATASASNAGMALEGPLGRRASWFASVRKSYLQYLIERTAGSDATLAFGFTDAQGTLAAELSSRHRVRLSVLGGYSDLDRTRFRDRLGMNSLMTSSYRFDMIQASSSYAGDRWIIDNRAAFIRETGVGRNRQELDLARGSYGEWVWHGNATFELARSAPLEFGASLRRMREEGASQRYQFNPFAVRPLDAFRGTGIRPGFYVQQSWSSTRGRASLSAGGRYDWHDVDGKSVWSPHVSGAVQPYEGSRLGFGWGTYGQFPELRQFYSFTGAPWLLPQRAIHYNVSFEQRLGTRSRARVEAYSRQDRDLLFRPLFDPRLINGQVFDPPALAPLRNALRGYARGVQFMLQSRTANGLTGWLSYAYGRAIAGGFPADFDQTHTVNVFASYRLRPSVNVSGRFSYGSGYPIPGYLREEGGRVYLSDRRNQLRVPSYSRVDARINKSFTRDRWKWTLYGEVVNMLDHDNLRFDDLNGYNPQTLQAFPRFDRMFPILPSVGIVAEF
jgi:hypothetical protein